jgi:hypothetical protein
MTMQPTGPSQPELYPFDGSESQWRVLPRLVVGAALMLAVLTLQHWLKRRRSKADPPKPEPSPPAASTATEMAFLELFNVAPVPAVVAILTEIFAGSAKALVLFRHGTIVVFDAMPEDPAQASREMLATHGPVVAGGPAGDFATHELTGSRGYLVSGASRTVFTYVSRLQLASGTPNMMGIGLYGRTNRHQDSRELDIVQVVTLSHLTPRE